MKLAGSQFSLSYMLQYNVRASDLLLANLFNSFGAVVLLFLGVSGVDGGVETFPRVQSDAVSVPGTHHTQSTIAILQGLYISGVTQ